MGQKGYGPEYEGDMALCNIREHDVINYNATALIFVVLMISDHIGQHVSYIVQVEI